jgi:excisionase family DNA binding protein
MTGESEATQTATTVGFNCFVNIPDDVLDQIADRVVDRLEKDSGAPWMNLDAAASYLSFPKKRLYNLVSAGEIPHRKQGNRLLFNRDELHRWLDLHYQGPEEFTP